MQHQRNTGLSAATRVFALFAALLFIGCASTDDSRSGAAPGGLTDQQRALNIESFDYVWNTVNEKYWDPTFGGVDWDAVRNELRPKLQHAKAMSDTRRIMQDMIERLGVSHFLIIPSEVYTEPKRPEGERFELGTTGITWRVYDGRALVVRVESDSPAACFGVHTGWEILRVGQTDIRHEIQSVSPDPGHDTPQQYELWRAVAMQMPFETGEIAQLSFLDGSDEIVDLDIPLVERAGQTSEYGYLGELTVEFESRRLPENIGYIRFSAFFDPPYVMDGFNRAMHSFLDADGVIIDLRGNGGGIGLMATGMAGWLIQEKTDLVVVRTRDDEMTFELRPRANSYTGPVVVLVDGLSGSASEFLSGGLQSLGRAHIVGQRTIGQALPGEFERLPNGDVFLYATSDIVLASGHRLEHNGVEPDTPVVPTRAALLEGKDPVLDAGVAWIRANSSDTGGALEPGS